MYIKCHFWTSALFFLLATTSCHAQKMVQKTSDAKRLEINKDKFVGKPLKVLLDKIGPQIKSALGNPEDKSDIRLNHISFYFVDKGEYYSRKSKGEHPTIINVTLKRPNGKEYPSLSPVKPWDDEKTQIYGDMIIVRITVSGGS